MVDHDDADVGGRDGRRPGDKAGVGSGVLNSFRQVGGSLGIAIMGAIVADRAASARRPPQPGGVRLRPAPSGMR